MRIEENPAWAYYHGNRYEQEGRYIEGKVHDLRYVPVDARTKAVIKITLDEEVLYSVKHSREGCNNPRSDNTNQYVICWYTTDGKADLRRLAKFLVDSDMVQKTKTGRLYNIAFKYDRQTHDQEYSGSFVAEIKLANFIDLNTGKPIEEK